jgi:hypothetical protein
MSLLLQALLGANVDGSGLSLHVDRRTSLDTCDNLPMAVGADEVAKEGQKHGWLWGLCVCHLVLYLYLRQGARTGKRSIEAVRDSEARLVLVRVQLGTVDSEKVRHRKIKDKMWAQRPRNTRVASFRLSWEIPSPRVELWPIKMQNSRLKCTLAG